jgi:hypothetical protein
LARPDLPVPISPPPPVGTGLASLDRGYGPKCVLRLAYSVRLWAPETGAPEQIGTPVRLVRNPA